MTSSCSAIGFCLQRRVHSRPMQKRRRSLSMRFCGCRRSFDRSMKTTVAASNSMSVIVNTRLPSTSPLDAGALSSDGDALESLCPSTVSPLQRRRQRIADLPAVRQSDRNLLRTHEPGDQTRLGVCHVGFRRFGITQRRQGMHNDV